MNISATSAIRDGDEIVLVPLPKVEAGRLYDRLVGQDPTANVRISGSADVSGASELSSILDIFRWGAFFAIASSLIAVLISIASLLEDRRAGNNYVQVLGVSPGRTVALTMIEVVTASGGAIAVSLFASWLWALSLGSAEKPLDVVTLVLPFVTAIAVLTAACFALVWATMRASGVSPVPDRDNLVATFDTYSAPDDSRARSGVA